MATVDDLTFTLSSDGTYYSVKATSTAIAGELEIPSEYSGLPVKEIDASGFKSCSKLTAVVVPESITALPDNAFQDCTGMTSLTLPSGLTTLGANSVRNCPKLTSIELPAGLTSIGDRAFGGCTKLATITVDSANTVFHSEGNCCIKTATNQLVFGCKNSVIPDYITSIGSSAFNGCRGLTSIELPASLTSIGDYAFAGCSGLTSIELPASLTSIGDRVFGDCTKLATITVDSANTVFHSEGNCCIKTATNQLVFGCKNSVIPDYITSIGSSAFNGCSGLTSIELPAGLTSIGGWAFYGCGGLTSIELPASLTSIGSGAFAGCSGLTSIELPAGLTSIGGSAFYLCTGLTSIELPAGLTSIGGSAFGYCTKLATITVDSANKTFHADGNCCIRTADSRLMFGCRTTVFPNYIRSINYGAFYAYTAPTSVVLPATLEYIDSAAFAYNTTTTYFKFEGDAPTMGSGVFLGGNRPTVIHVNAFATGYGDTWGGKPVVVDNPVYLGGNRVSKAYLGEKRVWKCFPTDDVASADEPATASVDEASVASADEPVEANLISDEVSLPTDTTNTASSDSADDDVTVIV